MAKPMVEILEDGEANIFFEGRRWRRTIQFDDDGQSFSWKYCSSEHDRGLAGPKFQHLLETIYRSHDSDEDELPRFPRVGVSDDYAGLFGIPTIGNIESPKHQWLVEGLISRGTLNLVTAPPGGYKTWLALWLAGCVSLGNPFLDRVTTKAEVLYLDNENPPSVIRQRCKMLRLDSSSLHVWGHWWKYPPPMINDQRLLSLAERHSPLIIFDPFVRFHGADENNARQIAKVFKRLRRIADTGSTILLLHHQAKAQGSQYRGSTDILAGVDAARTMPRSDSSNTFGCGSMTTRSPGLNGSIAGC
jgi:hypothetical protein